MLQFFADIFKSIADLLLLIADWIIGALVAIIAYVLGVLIDLIFLVFYAVIDLLPSMPEPDHSGIAGFQALAFANNYIPVTEVFTLLPILATIYVGVALYKLAKFLLPN